MNKKWVIAGSIVVLAVVQAGGQTSGGGGTSGGGTTGGGTSGGATTSSGSSGQSSTTVNPQTGVQNPQNPQQVPPNLQNRNQLPQGMQQRQLPPGIAGRTNFTAGFTNQAAITNQRSSTNEFAGRTNRFGTNLPPTGRGTNHFSSTNRFDHRHFDRDRFRDEAKTPGDQTLLIRIKQIIITQISVSFSGGNWIPIHCAIDSGHVRLMGLCRSMDEAQRLQATVSGMPGVTGVENGLSTLPQDQAATENDRVILAQIRQFIPLSQPPAPWTPVSFDVRQGTVGMVGMVPTVQESQRVEMTVRQVPGVVQTSNNLIVDTSINTGVTPTPTSTVPRR